MGNDVDVIVVIEAVTPKGVEHPRTSAVLNPMMLVIEAVTPKGVEHPYRVAG